MVKSKINFFDIIHFTVNILFIQVGSLKHDNDELYGVENNKSIR